MVVDIKRCIEEKIIIWCTTKEQSQQIWDDFHEYAGLKTIYKWGCYNEKGFEVSVCTHKGPEWQDGYNRKYFIDVHNAKICLDYNEVLLNKTRTYELW